MKNPIIKFTILFLLVALTGCSDNESIIRTEDTKQTNTNVFRPSATISRNVVPIGSQIWMTKNLSVTRYRNGELIPQVTNPTEWANLTTGAWCYYGNITSNGIVYGKLYNWYAVNDPRGLAPEGYHIPTNDEWTTLINYLGGESIAGGKMKATTLWNSPNEGATNSSGFTGFPGGLCNYDGPFYYMGDDGNWWSSSEDTPSHAWSMVLFFDGPDAGRSSDDKKNGFSVRCLRD